MLAQIQGTPACRQLQELEKHEVMSYDKDTCRPALSKEDCIYCRSPFPICQWQGSRGKASDMKDIDLMIASLPLEVQDFTGMFEEFVCEIMSCQMSQRCFPVILEVAHCSATDHSVAATLLYRENFQEAT